MAKYVDIPAIMQVIAGVYTNNKLLEDERYHFSENDFPEEFHKILFGSIYNLHQLGAEDITPEAIDHYLQARPKAYGTYKANKGLEYLKRLTEIVQLSTFDYYYSRVKKMTLLRMYHQTLGMDLSWLYDPDEILNIKKKQSQEDWFDNTSLEEMAETINDKIEHIRQKCVDGEMSDMNQAAQGLAEYLEDLKKNPEYGYPMYGPFVNTIFRGARLKKLYLRSASTGVGKALPNSTIIPTPVGERTVGEIKVGDYLFDAFGKPTKVLKVFPQGKKNVWEITFKDGRTAKCCDEHLWSYCTVGQRAESKKDRKFSTKTLKEISEKELYKKGSGYQILVPMNYAVEYPEKQYYLSPYSFGVLLGDGSFRYTSSQKAIMLSSENNIIPTYVAQEMNWELKKTSDKNYNWYFGWKDKSEHINVWVEEALKDYPELWNVKSDKKFIPKEYLEGSIEQRLQLLNGLLDTDGSIDQNKGRISYFTNSPQLRDDVIKLAQGLGFKATYFEDSHKDTSVVYNIEIAGRPEDKVKLFRLPRKKQLIENWYNNGKRKELNDFNPIVKIEKLDYSEEMTCFYVDNKEHLFLMNDFIVTHNTRTMIADACTFACEEIYDKERGVWERNNCPVPTLYITTEQDLGEIQTMLIAFVADIDEEHIITGKYDTGEWERVEKAIDIVQKAKLYIKELPDFTLQDIESVIKRAVQEYDIKCLCHDYIHSSMKILSEISGKAGVKGLREDNILFMISVRLKDLANQYGIFIMTSTQLNGEYRTSKELDQNVLRGAKSIADKVDAGVIMIKVTDEDKEALKPILSKGYGVPDIKMSVYKNRGNRYKDIILWCRSRRESCRIIPMFATDLNYELLDIEDTKIVIEPR